MITTSPDRIEFSTKPRWVVYGFLFWAAFLLVLEPDNMIRAARAGHRLSLDHELLRITVAAAIGAAVTPVVVWTTIRFPILGTERWRHAFIHALAIIGTGFGLIVTSCFVAAWAFERFWIPSIAEVRSQLASNWLLLIFALSFFTALAHAVRFSRIAVVPSLAPTRSVQGTPVALSRIPVKSKGRLTYLDIANVDWIETQGNYLALHVGSRMHLIRDTLGRLEKRLDPDQFIRVHRRTIVALNRIQDIRAEGNGDATLRLLDGREVRVSRSYGKAVRDRWSGSV